MKEFKDRVAVVTGGASGIGRAMAERFAAERMKVVIADVQEDALARAESEMKAKGAQVLPVRCDVSKASEVEALARKTLEAFGAVHVLCNNAGVAVAGTIWERSVADWEWVLGVNLWGVIHGIRVFVPIMIQQGTEGHVVNTASLAGLISGPGMAIYGVTKHSVVTMSETLYHELKLHGTKIGASVLCPAWVTTGIIDSQRNRPESLKADDAPLKPDVQMMEEMVRQLVSKGLKPVYIAERVFEAVRDDHFYILTHPEWNDLIRLRMEDILENRNPTFRPMAG